MSYFDESWDQEQKKILVIGGMVGRSSEWAKIERRWQELLDKYGLAYYRANEAENVTGEFKGSPFRIDGKRQFELLKTVKEEFFNAITYGRISGAAVGIPIDCFKQVANTPEILERFGGTPYYLCGHTTMLVLLTEIRFTMGSKDLMAFRFDQQDQFETEMMKVHDHLNTAYSDVRAMVGSMKFEDKKACLPLQVADTLAYECRKHLELMLVDPKAPYRPELKRLMDVRKIFKISLCENKCLEEYLNNYTAPNS